MKLFLSAFLALLSSQSIAQQRTTISTPYGSFGSLRPENQTISENTFAAQTVPGHTSVKTPDGGTATIIKFGSEGEALKQATKRAKPQTALTETAAIINICPNPNNGEMTIKYAIPGSKNSELNIYDLAGRKITGCPLKGTNGQLSISNTELHAGIYFYNVSSDNKIIRQDKIVIIK